MENQNFKGCLLSPVDVRDYTIACAAQETFPNTFELEVLPRVKSQGRVNSCVAHSTSTILEYYELIENRDAKLSTNFIYGIQKLECGHQGEGMYLRDACKIVCKYGDMTEKDCPGNTEVPECWDAAERSLTDPESKAAAEKFKIKTYFACNTTEAIKKALMKYGPILASIYWYPSYEPDANGILSTEKVGECGGHAFVIYGWNEKGFKCQNSWGEDWGDKGRFILPYEIPVKEARCFVDLEDNYKEAPIAEELNIPTRNNWLDFVYKVVNFLVNLVKQARK